MRQLKGVVRAQTLTGERIRFSAAPPHLCVTFGTLLDFSELQFSFVLNGHDSWSTLIKLM